ncbi:tRNA epoxyqueuosine(34) reductase QueG [Azospirillum ramasamyi]|uniref:Epoxyqueuosine reductase n=1 Tax=Azospirillum ramasamyi TaxID=682998 RepID=A0A2U9S6M8_9PROT|nr:tRNA epoxyqueuosine(34) reductase QueG [Azospirillum ramasamyi]AWU94176.1 tRNA epoxyqueuosine(34) reductase QueG [Azospirillum ramasamyi]
MAAAKPAPLASADPARLRDAIRGRVLAAGFDAVGFAPAALGPEARERLARFVAEGRHGDMGWMAERSDQRSHPRSLWDEARSVIALGTSYAPHDDPRRLAEHPDRGIVSVYARNRDYHDLIKGRLKTLAQWLAHQTGAGVKVFVDTAPVMEKPLAEQAGLGWQGKHTNLVSRDHGSWLFLGEIYTTLELPPDPPARDRCGSCDRCQTACPTAAFPAPYQIDARRCVSYLTIEHKGPIPDELKPLMGNRIYGCDDCLAACPWNKFARASLEPAFLPRAELTAPRLADLAQLDDAGFRQVFSGSPIKRIGRDRFVRNVLVAIGNSGDPSLRPVAEALRQDASDVVRETADWAAARLGEAAPPTS